MKATSGDLPAGDGWVYEVKWDGMRAVIAVDVDAEPPVRIQTTNGRDATVSFPEVAGLATALGVRSAVLDGELCALDPAGRPDFGLLQQRMHVTNPRAVAERAATVPVTLLVFDLLAVDGTDTTTLPWTDRRRLLERLVEPGPHWQVPAVHDDGASLLTAADANGLEGVVAKRTDSVYRPGTRTKQWVKVKVRRRQEFVVGGWAPGTGSRTDRIGGLLVGYHDAGAPPGGPLRYAGRVGSGLGDDELATLAARFADLATDEVPFDPPPPRAHTAGARWVRPEIVVEVAYAEWTGEGRLRHPTYCGRRIDVDPATVTAAP